MKLSRLLSLLLLALAFTLQSLAAPTGRAARIVLVHPTKANLETFLWLIDHRVLDIPQPEIVGIYHKAEATNYASAHKFAADNPSRKISLVALDAPLEERNLFVRNACTDAFRSVWQGSDGMFFWGGPDIQPSVYGEKTSLLTVITDPARHRFELSLLFHLLGGSQNTSWKPWLEENPKYPILSFCLGMQSMNVATGGTLVQDIPTEIYGIDNAEGILAAPTEQVHRNYQRHFDPSEELIGGSLHRIRLLADGFFARVMGFDARRTPTIYSSHHQSVEKLGQGFSVIATSMDGKVVEAIHHMKFRNVLGVQFHPEPTILYGGPRTKKVSPSDAAPADYQKGLETGDGAEFHRAYWACVAKMLTK